MEQARMRRLDNSQPEIKEQKKLRDSNTRRVIYELECLMFGMKDDTTQFELLTAQILELAGRNFSKIFGTSGIPPKTKDIESSASQEPYQNQTNEELTYSQESVYWRKVQDELREETPSFVFKRTRGREIRHALYKLEEILLFKSTPTVHTDMIKQADQLIKQHVYSFLQTNSTQELPNPPDSSTSSALIAVEDGDPATQLRKSKEIVERAEIYLGISDEFRNLGVPARLHGVVAAVKRTTDRLATLEATLNDDLDAVGYLQELMAQNARLQEELTNSEELIRSLIDPRQQPEVEHKLDDSRTSKQFHSDLVEVTSAAQQLVQVPLPFARAPLHCDRSVVQAVLCFLADPYPEFSLEDVSGDTCSTPTTVDLCQLSPQGCVACCRHEYRRDTAHTLRGVCDGLLVEQTPSEAQYNDRHVDEGNLSAATEKERYGFEIHEEVQVWEQKLYVQWTRGPIQPVVSSLSTNKQVHRNASDEASTLAPEPSNASEATDAEKHKATVKLCLMQLQRVEAALHPTRVTFPDAQRTSDCFEDVPQRLLGVIKSIAELQKENNKVKRVAASMEETVTKLQNDLDRAHEAVSSPSPLSSPVPLSQGSSLSQRLCRPPIVPSAAQENEAHLTAKLEKYILERVQCEEVVGQLEVILQSSTTVSSTGKVKTLPARLRCVLNSMRNVYFLGNMPTREGTDAAVERLTQELQSTQLLLSEALEENHRSSLFEARADQMKEYHKQLEKVAIVLAENQYVSPSCTPQSLISSGDIPRQMRRMGEAHTAARAAIELVLQEGVTSKGSIAAQKVWSQDTLDIVGSIRQAITSSLWPIFQTKAHTEEVSKPAQDLNIKTEEPELPSPLPSSPADAKTIADPDYFEHKRGGRVDAKSERMKEVQHKQVDDVSSSEEESVQKIGADSKHLDESDDKVSDSELTAEEEAQVQRLLQELYDEEAATAEANISKTDTTAIDSAVVSSVGEGNVSHVKLQVRESSPTGDEAGFVLI